MATDVTVIGVAGTTVTIPFASSDNYVLAQLGAGLAIDMLADASKFVASGAGAATTAAAGILSNIDGASITGTAANSTVIAGGSRFAYTAAADGQSIFFSAGRDGNLLANGGRGTLFNLDAGGSPSVYGTSLDATGGTATVNAHSGYLSVRSASGGLVTVNVSPGTTQGIAYSGAEGLIVNDAISDNLALTSPNNVTVNAAGANVTLAGGGAFQLNASGSDSFTNAGAGFVSIAGAAAVTLAGGAFYTGTGASLSAIGTTDVINSGTGIAVDLADGAAVTVQAFPFTSPVDSVFAAGSGSVFASGAQALITQAAAGNFAVGSGFAGQATLNAAAAATETIAYLGPLVLNAGTADNLTLAGTDFVTLTVGDQDTIAATAGAPISLAGAGANVTLAGGNFYTGTDPVITAIGTSNVINSAAGLAVTFTDGAAATVQAFPFTSPTDTITAQGAGSVFASGANAIVNQTGTGDLGIGEGYGGVVTVNAASGATEALDASTIPGVAVTYNLDGGSFNITGNRPTVNAAGTDTISFSGLDAAIVNEADATALNLAGGQFYVSTAGAGAGVTFSGADTITFASTDTALSVLGATSAAMYAGGGGGDTVDALSADSTRLFTGTNTFEGLYYIDPGDTDHVLYLGTPYRTAADGAVVESFGSASDFTANNVVVLGGSGSQTVFGGGDAFRYGVAYAEYGGGAGSNLLVGAQSIYGGGGGDTLQAGAFTTYIQATDGNTTLIGGNGSFNGTTTFNALDETLTGGAGDDSFIFGSSNETLSGTGGANQYTDLNQTAAGTTITVTDFTSGTDVVNLFSLSNAALSGATANVSGQTQDGSDALVTLSDGVTIRFQGVTTVAITDFNTNLGTIQVGKVS